MEPLTGLSSNEWLLDLLQNIRLGWKRLTLGNALAYYDMVKFSAVKSFSVQALWSYSQDLILLATYEWAQ